MSDATEFEEAAGAGRSFFASGRPVLPAMLVGTFLIFVAAGCAPSYSFGTDPELRAARRESFSPRAPVGPPRASVGPPRASLRPPNTPSDVELPDLSAESKLGDYLLYAALNNPGLRAAFNRWKAALEEVPQVATLPDPKFTYGYYIQEVETRVGPQDQRFALAQMFPWFGKLKLRGDVAWEAAQGARQRYEGAKLRLFFRVQNAYFEYYYLGRAIDTVRANLELMEYLEGVARTAYEAGEAQHADVIRAQVELGKLDDRLRSLQDLREPVVARLNAALNRAPDAEVPQPTRAPDVRIRPGDEQVLRWFRRSNPELKALRHQIARAEHAVALAGKQYYPDVTLGVNLIDTDEALMPGVEDSGKDPLVATVSVNLPIWWQKYRAGEREALSRRRAAVHQRRERENALSAEIEMVLFKLRDAARKIDLFRDTLVPKARQSLRSTETAYRAGDATFLDLIDAERVLLEFQLSFERALADHAQRLSELEMLVGRDVPTTGRQPQGNESPEQPRPRES